LGGVFFGESMFSHATDASKIALTALVCFCQHNQIELIDCQQKTQHLMSLGAKEIPRVVFQKALAVGLEKPSTKHWFYDPCMWSCLPELVF
jgi:leucyl/phenylalanyl-tRNA---protein transferase